MKKGFKECIKILLLGLLNIMLSFCITYHFKIMNVTLYHSIISNTDITYEVIIFLLLSIIQTYWYEKKTLKK